MIYDELIEELALTLLTKARYEGCISVIDGFSQCEEDKTRIEYPIDGVMRIMPVGSEIWPEECEPLLKKIGAETIGDVADYENGAVCPCVGGWVQNQTRTTRQLQQTAPAVVGHRQQFESVDPRCKCDRPSKCFAVGQSAKPTGRYVALCEG